METLTFRSLYLQTVASPWRQPKTELGIQLGLSKDSHQTMQPTDYGRVKSYNLTLKVDYHPSICPNYITQYFRTLKDCNRNYNPGNLMCLHTLLLIHKTNIECFSQVDLSKKYLLIENSTGRVLKSLYTISKTFLAGVVLNYS